MTGPSPVHDRYIDRVCRIQSLTWDTGNSCCTPPPLPAARLCWSFIPVAVTHTRSTLRGASIRWRGPIRQPAPAAGTNKASPPPSASRTAKEPAGRDARHTCQASSPGARVTGQNGRGSAKRAVTRTARSARTLSAYLHRHVTASGFGDGPFSVLGRASVCSLALIAAGSCERAAGSGGAKRPRSGAAGALDAAAREQIMGCGGKGANRGSAVSGLAWGLSCWGPG